MVGPRRNAACPHAPNSLGRDRMTVVRGASVGIAILLLAGCFRGSDFPEPAVRITRFAPTFDEPFLVAELEFANFGQQREVAVLLQINLHTHRADPNSNSTLHHGPPEEWESFHAKFVEEVEGVPLTSVYYSDKARELLPAEERPPRGSTHGPFDLLPGESQAITIVFAPPVVYRGDEGFHSGRVGLQTRMTDDISSDHVYVGCFNVDTPVYYGRADGRPTCPIYNFYNDAEGIERNSGRSVAFE